MALYTGIRATSRLRLSMLACSMLCGFSSAAWAQDAQPASAAAQAPSEYAPSENAPSENAMVNLIRLLVQQGIIKPEQGEALMRQALAEAEKARAAAPSSPALAAAPPPGTVRVPYVPETVKRQIKDEVRQEVMAQAKSEGWAQPNQLPGWLSRFSFFGDVRVRSQYEFYPEGNDTNGLQVDFSAINRGSPLDIEPSTNTAGFPTLNSTENRNNQLRLRARLGVNVALTDWASATIRLATGNNDSPISTNVDLGGGFTKKDIFLDQAFIKVEVPFADARVGRFSVPFFSTDLLWDEDLNFDGIALGLNSNLLWSGPLTATLRGGAFPLQFTATNEPTNEAIKSRSRDKWLFAAQGQLEWKPIERVTATGAVAYYHFKGVQGRLSEPCATFLGDECSTDQDRPAFQTKGNTLSPLRSILGPANVAVFAQPQYFGLTFDYRLLDVNAEIKAKLNDDLIVKVNGNYVRNLAYDESVSALCGLGANGLPLRGTPFNNFIPGTLADGTTDFNSNPCTTPVTGGTAAELQSGPNAWLVRALVGYEKTRAFGEWSISAGYKYIEPDALLDGYTESDFHLGGTNAKGYFVTGNFGLFDNVWLTGRWLSADQVYGPRFGIDVLQLDLNASF